MKKNTSKTKGQPTVRKLMLSETAAGEQWLLKLTEPEFRDKILAHLFSRMKKAGLIDTFQNIHGRNDKGIDYLLALRSPLQRSILGIQVKSKRITRTGDSNSLSSLTVRQECEAAMKHEFNLERDAVRLDNVALWTSNHITEDAEKEFLATGQTFKIQVIKPLEVFELMAKYTPEYLAKIPECALSQYVGLKADPKPKALKIFGVQLHPRKHFLKPTLSLVDVGSSRHIKESNRGLVPKTDKIDIHALLTGENHVIIKAGELTGKSYLLEHLQCIAAERGLVPFLLAPGHFVKAARTIFHILIKELPTFGPKELAAMVKNVRAVVFIDDIDKIENAQREMLFALDPKEVTVIGTAKTIVPPANVKQYHILGVDLESLPGFLRSLDVAGGNMIFTDRAHSFIARSFASSGLPNNRFFRKFNG